MKLLRNEKGLSLAELLATLVISSLLIIFIMSIHIFIQKQYNNQKEDTQHLTDVTIAVKVMTKDIRKAEADKVFVENGQLLIKENNEEDITYRLENNVIKKNEADFIYKIKEFAPDRNEDRIHLKIVSQSGKEIETEIVLREG